MAVDSALPAPVAHAALAALAVAPLLVQVPVNASIVLTAAITVLVGCWRSVKPEPPPEAMTKSVRARVRLGQQLPPPPVCRPCRLRRRLPLLVLQPSSSALSLQQTCMHAT